MEDEVFKMDMEEEAVLVLGGKKKVKKVIQVEEVIEDKKKIPTENVVINEINRDGTCIEILKEFDNKWNNSDAEYEYKDLLLRGVTILKSMKEKQDNIEKKKRIIKPPKINYDGPRKTVFSNYLEIADILKRDPKEFGKFIEIDFGTTYDIDGEERMILKGRFKIDAFENTIRKYIDEYVICKVCDSLNTNLKKDKDMKLTMLQCNHCTASRTVAKMKKGYIANTERSSKDEDVW